MMTIFLTENLRGMKRGNIIQKESENFTIQWDLPVGLFDAFNIINPVQKY